MEFIGSVPPQRPKVHVRIRDRARRNAEEWKGATGPEMNPHDRRMFRSIDDKAPRVGARNDCTGEAFAFATTPGIVNPQLILAEVEHDFHRAARKNSFPLVRRRIAEMPESLDERVEWGWHFADGVMHGNGIASMYYNGLPIPSISSIGGE